MSETIAYRYDEKQNPGGRDKDGVLTQPASLPFAPLRDITEAEFNELAPWQQRSIAACPFYAVTAPRFKAPKEDAPEEATPEPPAPAKTSRKAATDEKEG